MTKGSQSLIECRQKKRYMIYPTKSYDWDRLSSLKGLSETTHKMQNLSLTGMSQKIHRESAEMIMILFCRTAVGA